VNHSVTAASGPNPIVVELVKGRMAAARSELEALIERTAMSPVIREKKDYFVAVFSRDGRLITGTTFPLGANALEAIFDHFPPEKMSPGDIYAYNDPYTSSGGVSHTPDLVLVEPVFHESRLVAFVQVFGHLWDVGGLAAGSVSPLAREIFHEGIRLPPVRLRRAGEDDDTIERVLIANTRFPEVMRGDLRALAAACRLGAVRVCEIVDRFGVEVVESVIEGIFAQGRAIATAGFAQVPDGSHEFTEYMDSDDESGQPNRIVLELKKRANRVEVDATRTSNQSPDRSTF
jgi:N-methylhydantoinase B